VTAVALTVYSGDNDPSSRVRSLLGLEPSVATRQGRALLSAGGSCGETPGWEKNGGIVAYIVGVFFMFLGIAIVCDDFFVASLEKICEVLRLSDDVAGATFMAAGSSAPELASSAMSLINPNAGSEIGVGTIVGSAIFNILIIIGATVIATGNTLQLDWKPVTRDCFFYAAAIGGIVGTFAGGRVDWWEGGIYVAFYASYIITMMYNVRLMRWLDSFETSATVKSFKARLSFRSARAEALSEQRSEREAKYRAEGEDIRAGDARTDETAAETARRVAAASKSPSDQPRSAKALWGKIRDDIVVKVPKHNFANVVLATAKDWKAKQAVIVHDGGAPGDSAGSDGDAHVLTPTMTPGHIRAYRSEAVKAAKLLAARDKAMHERAAAIARAIEEGSIADESEAASSGFPELPEEEDDESSPWSVPEDKKEWPMWALSLPWYAAFQLTIPPCGNPKWEKWYVLSFAMSIVWIGFITHWMVEWCVRIGCILKIPSVVMGTTVLAAGTSIPDALSSIAVARDGLADMAVANAVGSNVFDIWLGLGLPWLLYLSWQTPNYILVNTDELIPSSIILAGVLVVYYGSIATNGFKLTVRMGYIYMGVYALYALYSIFLVWLVDIYGLNDKSTLRK
jgi:K+-dependent Na+/Ca+ exchanger-like protein